MKKHIILSFLLLIVVIISYGVIQFLLDENEVSKTFNKESSERIQSNKDFIEGEKTVIQLYKYLKLKGWKLDKIGKAEILPFGSKEAIGFKLLDKKTGFLILRFDSEEIAKGKFPLVDKIYKGKYGGAVIEKNFIIGFFSGRGCFLSTPPEMALEQDDVIKLHLDLKQYCSMSDKTLLTELIVPTGKLKKSESNKRCSGLGKSAR
jgi:hypothetical protein